MLKFDFYKIFKSKMLLIFFIITLCTVLVNPLMFSLKNAFSVYSNLFDSTPTLSTVSWLFIVPFVTKDFSSKYTKNFAANYSLSDRIFYVLSKLVYIAAFCVLYMLLQLVVEIIFNYTLGTHCMYKKEGDMLYQPDYFTVGEFYLRYFIWTLNCIAAGTVFLFLCLLFKREYIAIIIVLPYIFLCNEFYRIIESLVGRFLHIYTFDMSYYTIFGLDPGDYSGKEPGIKIAILLSYMAVFIAGSLLVFAKKGLKDGDNSDGLISVTELKKSFGKKSILADINLNIGQGELYGLIGNNGAGKTTLLKMFCNMLKPTAGAITLNRQAFNSSVRIGSLIESPALYFDMTGYQNIKAKALALNVKYTNDQINGLLQLVGLQDTGKKDVRAYSMGMKQRLGIAMALVGEPDLLILDEPINGLDPQGILEIRNLLEKIHKERNVTMIISSHILDELAKTATRFCVLNKGKIIKNCTKDEFLSDCGDNDISEYYLQLIQTN